MPAGKTSASGAVPSRIKRRGVMLVLSAPSGGGKTTITRQLLEQDPDVTISVSATTRPIRPGEVDGKHYYFVSQEKFGAMVRDGAFLEYAEIYGNFYGTLKSEVEKALAAEKDVLFDIDWQGMRQLKETMPDDVASIYILPPSRAELEKRLRARAQDPEEVIRRRLNKAAEEVEHCREYNYIIINRDLDKSVARVRGILEAERMRSHRLSGVQPFIDDLKTAKS